MTTSLKEKREINKATRRSGIKIFSENEKAKNEAIASKGVKLKNMNKIKGKSDSSENKFVERKALADLSNVPSNASAKEVYDGSKPMKNGRNAILERVSMPPAARTASVSSIKSFKVQDPIKASVSSIKSFKGKERGHLNQALLGVQTSKTGTNDLRTSLNYQSVKTKNGERKSVATTSRITKISVPMRKSLPLLKKEKTTEASGSMAKTKIRESATQQANSAKNLHFRNRGSDGFVKLPPKVQSNAATVMLPRSLKPTFKTSLRLSNSQTTSKSKRLLVPRKPASVAVISSEKQVEEFSHQKDNVAVIPNEASQRELPPSGNNDTSRNRPDMLDKKKTKRRRSYTSLLMAGSKLLENHSGVDKEENLTGIDNDRNPLEVAQYVDEIYQYYWVTEALDPPLENYMSIQTEITPRMRGILVNWLIEVHLKFDLMQETLYLMVSLLDRYLSEVQIKKSDMQLVGLTALLLASKYEDFWHPRVKELISISAETYSCEQMLKMEKHVLKTLKFRLNAPTPYVFMLRFIKAAQSDSKLEHLAFYLIELCLVEYEALKFKPSLLCASAMYVGRCTLQMTPFWTPLLSRHARYDVSEIRECAEMILRFQKAATSGQLRVTYEKYTSNELNAVATIEPLDTLPS